MRITVTYEVSGELAQDFHGKLAYAPTIKAAISGPLRTGTEAANAQLERGEKGSHD